MSTSSNAIELDEARDLCDHDLVACERDHYKDLCGKLARQVARLAPTYHAYAHSGPSRFADCPDSWCIAAREALAKAKDLSPARDAGTTTDR